MQEIVTRTSYIDLSCRSVALELTETTSSGVQTGTDGAQRPSLIYSMSLIAYATTPQCQDTSQPKSGEPEYTAQEAVMARRH